MKNVLKKELSSNVVFKYEPQPFPLVTSPVAQEFISSQNFTSTDFQINPLAAQQSGIAQLQKNALDERVEEEALLKLKDVQEKAYKEAHEMGLAEGREQAFEEHRKILSTHVDSLMQILQRLEDMKPRLLLDHETHFVRMVYELASRIAMREIAGSPESILPVLQQVVADAQSEENVTIRVSGADLAFIEQVKERIGRDSDHIRRIRFEADEKIESGGCLLETNFGSIDATIAQRVERAWHTLEERMPKPDQRTKPVGGGSEGET